MNLKRFEFLGRKKNTEPQERNFANHESSELLRQL